MMELGASVTSHADIAGQASSVRRNTTLTSATSHPIEDTTLPRDHTKAASEADALIWEAEFLKRRREHLQLHHPQELQEQRVPLGVAFSGGGVRAAAFHCGLLWAISSQGLLKDVLHLASVSGGAYTAASLATHLVKAMEKGPPHCQSLDAFYREVAAETILRMQSNINYLVRLGEGHKNSPDRAHCPRLLDIPLFIFTIVASACLSPALILVNTVWPLVLCIEHELAGTLRGAWCDPDHSNFSSGLFEWTRLRLVWGTGLLSVTGILLAILAQVGCCRPKPGRYWPHLLRRSLQQVLLRGAICYTIYLCVPWVLLEMQNLSWGTRGILPDISHGHGAEWVQFYCWRYVTHSVATTPTCVDYETSNDQPWYFHGENSLYMNATWVAKQKIGSPTGVDPCGATGYTTPMFLAINGIVLAAGLVGLLFGLSLLRWYLTVAGPLWSAFFVAQVAQWQIFGPLTGQALIAPGLLRFTETDSSWVFHLCIFGAVLTLPVYDMLIKLMHSYYRRSLQLAYFCDGEDIDFTATAECPYCPHLLLGACVNDFRTPQEEKLLCDFTLSPLYLGCPRTGFFCTDSGMRLGYAMSVSAAAPDTFMLTKFDVLPIRFVLSVFSLRLGDFVRLEPDGKVAIKVGRTVRRLEEAAVHSSTGGHAEQHGQTAQYLAQRMLDRAIVALPFIGCHLLLVLGKQLGNAGDCFSYGVVLQIGLSGFVVVLVLSFFAFAPQMRWLMRSPLILQFQMMFMHRHQAARPPPYVYLSDGGLIECLGVLMLLRRRMPLILCSDACEDMSLTLRALRDTIELAREERLCSFFDMHDPRRDVHLAMEEWRKGHSSYLRLGIRYERLPGEEEPLEGELLYIRMRLAPGDAALERPILEKQELLQDAETPRGSAFSEQASPATASRPQWGPDSRPFLDETMGDSLEAPSSSPRSGYRRDMDGVCCEGSCCGLRRCGRKFPDFGTGNQFLQPKHFANLCFLGAEMSLPAVRHAAAKMREAR